MDDEFDRLIKLFSLDQKEKEQRMEEIFSRSMDFFDKYKYIVNNGSESEKADIQENMDILRAKLKEENENNQTRLGLSRDDLEQITNDPKNFSQEQWEFLQKAKTSLSVDQSLSNDKEIDQKKMRKQMLKDTKKKLSSAKRFKWTKS